MVDNVAMLKLNDIDTASTLSRRIGTYTVRTPGRSSSRGGGRSSVGTSEQLTRRDLVTPAELCEWSADTGLLLVGGDATYAVPCPELSRRFPNGLLRLGDEAHNREVRLAAREAAGARGNARPPVWGGAAPGVAGTGVGAVGCDLGFDPLA